MPDNKALLSAPEILQKQLNLAKVGYWVINAQTGEIDASDMFWEILGYEPDELEPTMDNLKKIHNLDDWENGWNLIGDLFQGKTDVYENEIRYLTKDRRWLWCEVKGIITERDDAGNPLTFVGYTKDVSGRRALESRLNQLIKKHQGELGEAQSTIETLSGILPICSKCKSIRNDEGYWKELEQFIETHTELVFSHGMCEKCIDHLYGDQGWYQRYKAKMKKKDEEN